MTSAAHRSESALAELALSRLVSLRAPRVLIGGLGMGFTLRAALDRLPPDARVTVAELHGCVVSWCRGPLAGLTAAATDDPRVRVELGDVAEVMQPGAPYDAILLDLFAGPSHPGHDDPQFGDAALGRVRRALAPAGVFAVWSEQPDIAFERRLAAAGFEVERRRPGRGGRRHAVTLGVRGSDTRDGRRRARVPRRRA